MSGGMTFMPIVIVDLKVAGWRTRAAAGMGESGELRNSLDKN